MLIACSIEGNVLTVRKGTDQHSSDSNQYTAPRYEAPALAAAANRAGRNRGYGHQSRAAPRWLAEFTVPALGPAAAAAGRTRACPGWRRTGTAVVWRSRDGALARLQREPDLAGPRARPTSRSPVIVRKLPGPHGRGKVARLFTAAPHRGRPGRSGGRLSPERPAIFLIGSFCAGMLVMHIPPGPVGPGDAAPGREWAGHGRLAAYVSLLAFLSIGSSAIACREQVKNVTTMHVSCARGVW